MSVGPMQAGPEITTAPASEEKLRADIAAAVVAHLRREGFFSSAAMVAAPLHHAMSGAKRIIMMKANTASYFRSGIRPWNEEVWTTAPHYLPFELETAQGYLQAIAVDAETIGTLSSEDRIKYLSKSIIDHVNLAIGSLANAEETHRTYDMQGGVDRPGGMPEDLMLLLEADLDARIEENSRTTDELMERYGLAA